MLVLAATAAGAAKAEELDGEILGLVREFKGREIEIDKWQAIEDRFGWRSPEGSAAHAEIRRLVDRGWEIRDRVAQLPAKTPEGIAAKAWLALWETCDGDPEGGPIESTGTRVAWSLARDILGRAGA